MLADIAPPSISVCLSSEYMWFYSQGLDPHRCGNSTRFACQGGSVPKRERKKHRDMHGNIILAYVVEGGNEPGTGMVSFFRRIFF